MAENVLLEFPYDKEDIGSVFKIKARSHSKFVIELECPIKHTLFTLKEVDKIIDALLRFRMRYET